MQNVPNSFNDFHRMSVYIIWEELGLCTEIFWVISYQNTTVPHLLGIDYYGNFLGHLGSNGYQLI